MKPSGVTSTMDIAIETDPIAAVTFATYIKKFSTINASYPEPLFDISGGEAFVNSIGDISGDVVTLPLEETPENFVKGFSFSPRSNLNSSTEYFNRCQGYEKEYKQLEIEKQNNYKRCILHCDYFVNMPKELRNIIEVDNCSTFDISQNKEIDQYRISDNFSRGIGVRHCELTNKTNLSRQQSCMI